MTKNTPLAVAMFITFAVMTAVLSVGYHVLLGGTAWLIVIPTSIIYGMGWVICYLILVDGGQKK